jgi:hypothetical protein
MVLPTIVPPMRVLRARAHCQPKPTSILQALSVTLTPF